MKTRNSPVPEALQWIPTVINWIDDCQDLLFTGLVLSLPLLRRVPAYWLPLVGWVLFINDIANMVTGVLAVALGGRSWKRASLDVMEKLVTNRVRRVGAVHSFFDASLFWPAVIQGGQALEFLTGYGLQLGALMGLITDSFWGTIRSVQGSPLVIRSPPPTDIFGKAARVLVQSHQLAYIAPILSRQDLDLIIGATALSQTIVGQGLPTNRLFARPKIAESLQVPIFEPWSEASRDALDLEGVPWREELAPELRPYVPTATATPNFEQALKLSAQTMQRTERTLGEIYGPTNHGTAMALLYNQATLEPWHWQSPTGQGFKPLFEEVEIDVASAVEYAVWPNNAQDPETVRIWFQTARELAAQQGYAKASFESLKTSANLHTDGWHRRTFATFRPGRNF